MRLICQRSLRAVGFCISLWCTLDLGLWSSLFLKTAGLKTMEVFENKVTEEVSYCGGQVFSDFSYMDIRHKKSPKSSDQRLATERLRLQTLTCRISTYLKIIILQNSYFHIAWHNKFPLQIASGACPRILFWSECICLANNLASETSPKVQPTMTAWSSQGTCW